jgi:hypothetical protein
MGVRRVPLGIRSERGRALEELRTAVEATTGRGIKGEVEVEDYLAELLLRRFRTSSRRPAGDCTAR